MFNFIKQLFCNHIEKLEDSEYLYSKVINMSNSYLETSITYANHYVCLKCNRKRIEQSTMRVY